MKDHVKRRSTKPKWIAGIVFFCAIIFLIYDIIITQVLALVICSSWPDPKYFVKGTVEFPESVYWEDNVYPGFDETDRLLTIRNFLDGKHIKSIALNDPNDIIYWFEASEGDWEKSRNIRAGKEKGNYWGTMDEETYAIASRGKTFSKQSMPDTRYKVVFNRVPLTEYQSRYFWADEVTFINTETREIIAYSRRLMRKFYRIMPDMAGNRLYYPSTTMCGHPHTESLDKKVFEKSHRRFSPSKHAVWVSYLSDKEVEK